MKPKLSILIPTRERAKYLKSALDTCTSDKSAEVEILVLDNASQDDTQAVVAQCDDQRVKYYRSTTRLSMRDNFERGLDFASGEILCFIGDDDGLLPHTIRTVLKFFNEQDIDALAAARASYFWPDLKSKHANTARLPRKSEFNVFNSRVQLYGLLKHGDYYRLPCLYHGFVKKDLVDDFRKKHGRFFLSSQPDIFSSIALSMYGVNYCLLNLPLVINGASVRSNGASHFASGGGQQEARAWKLEDDLGFLPGYKDCLTVSPLIIESGMRYGAAEGVGLFDIFDKKDCEAVLLYECFLRSKVGRGNEARPLFKYYGFENNAKKAAMIYVAKNIKRPFDLFAAFIRSKPIDCNASKIEDISQASKLMGLCIEQKKVGFLSDMLAQMRCAIKLVSPKVLT
jgi:glycosyltransferase involved in cell wall biosynthesis